MSTLKKCIVWDLDDTIWDGVVLEGNVTVRPGVRRAIEELDRRGILHSIASRGDEQLAMSTLREAGMEDYFLAPQIGWQPKSQSILAIARELGLQPEAMAFVDDDPFEREQAGFMLPGLLTIEAGQAAGLPARPEFSPGEVTAEAGARRRLYSEELERKAAEQGFGSREEFLLSCRMRLAVRPMAGPDVPRVLELMTRTHQLNATGLVFSAEELLGSLCDVPPRRTVTVAELDDRFGTYGIIGAAVADEEMTRWRLRCLALSCRVMGRGVERAFLALLVHHACRSGCTCVEAEFRDTGRNRMMRALYQMMGFRQTGAGDGEARSPQGTADTLIFGAGCDEVPGVPRWIEVV